MGEDEVKAMIEQAIPGAQATVTADGNKYTAVVVAETFEGMTMVAEQKMIYAALGEPIRSGAIHALTIEAYTPAEWAGKNG